MPKIEVVSFSDARRNFLDVRYVLRSQLVNVTLYL